MTVLCDTNNQERQDGMAARVFFGESEAGVAMRTEDRQPPVSAATLMDCFPAAFCGGTDGVDDVFNANGSASLQLALSSHEPLPSVRSEVGGGYEERTELPYTLRATNCCGLPLSSQEPHDAAYMKTGTLPSSQTVHGCLGTDNTAADISPALFEALLSCTSEMIEVTQIQPQTQWEKQTNQLFSDQAMEYLRVRLLPSGICFLSHKTGAQPQQPQQSTKACVALSWFLQHHHNLAATMMSMGFNFLVGLKRYQLSWKKAVEVPLAGLQLLASYAHVVSFHHAVNTFDTQSPREHLLVMAACLLASWKYAEIGASVTTLVSILNRTFFRRQRVLSVKDVIQLEFVVLGACGLCVEVPCWWRVAIELFTELLLEEEEAQVALGGAEEEEPRTLWSHAPRESGAAQHVKEAKLQQLLLASERLLLFVMDVAAEGGGRDDELRGALRRWMSAQHPLLGVALAVASGAMGLDWAASRVAPTGGAPFGGGGTSGADGAAQREVRAMVAVLTEALRQQ